MHRFYLPPEECSGDCLVLGGVEAHYAIRVLRIQPKESVTVVNGAGDGLLGQVREVRKSEVILDVLSRKHVPPPSHRLTLAAATPKGQIFDEIVEQATELGVSEIIPLMTERGNVRFDPLAALTKQSKWTVTAIEAMKQSGALWLPKIHRPCTLEKAIDGPHLAELSLLASLLPLSKEVQQSFGEFQTIHHRGPSGAALWIGPEGDFSPKEIQQLMDQGCHPITLGRQTLRCATAALAGVALIAQEFRLLECTAPQRLR